MQLVEIIKGKNTSNETLARAFDYVQQIGKIPIVVNDSRGFFTSRVFGCFVQEALAMLGEGLPAAMIENAALAVGMPVGALAVQDEVSMTLTLAIAAQAQQDAENEGRAWQPHPGQAVSQRMVEEFKRAGKAAGAGFYDYPQGGKKSLWPGLQAAFEKAGHSIPWQDMCDRLLYIQSIETIRCLEENVLENTRDANIGSIFGIGFPAWTGGAVQFANHIGLAQFEARAKQLQQSYGERFAVPNIVTQKLQDGLTF